MTEFISSKFGKPMLVDNDNFLYSLTRKQCSKFSNKFFSVIFSVKLIEILHASTYDI